MGPTQAGGGIERYRDLAPASRLAWGVDSWDKPDMLLHQTLAAKRDDVMRRWMEQVQGTRAPAALPTLELQDHLPAFLDYIIALLRDDAAGEDQAPDVPPAASAAGHGRQRLRLGFSLDSVVREYGALREAMVATARDAGAEISFRELEVLLNAIIDGIAKAVSEYTFQRDAELLRQTNEHFAFVAHELRNPLSSAMTSFQLLRASGQLPTAGRAVASLERGLQRTRDLIDQTLQIARVSSGVELRRQWFSLRVLFEDAEVAVIPEAEAKSVELRMEIEDDQPVHLDLRMIRSAVSNLLHNAVKYSHPATVVTMRGRVRDERAVIQVEDHCGGLEPGQVEDLFAPFTRIDPKQRGFGLGLAIAKQAVDAHGGSIRVQNMPGKGCMFVLELPTERSSAP